jgi:leucyl-tRNA synthetase
MKETLLKILHCARKPTEGIEGFAFNKSVAALYGLTNALAKSRASTSEKRNTVAIMARLMQPMTPHLAEEIWQRLGHEGLVTGAAWPELESSLLVEDSVTLPIQINGKRRSEISVAKDADQETIRAIALADDAVVRALDGDEPKKLIVVPGRIVNVVI